MAISTQIALPVLKPPSRPLQFGSSRDFLCNRYVYVLVSARARGLSVGINVNPDKLCNFDCVYCEVDRRVPGNSAPLDVALVARELESTLTLIRTGALLQQPRYRDLPSELARLRHVAFSGDGEPTLSSQFLDIAESVIHLRARGRVPFFKVVLITNASRLGEQGARDALALCTRQDEVWAKLDGGSQAYLGQINRPDLPVEEVLAGILSLARERPVVIQTLLPLVDGQEPAPAEIAAYIARLNYLKTEGAQIPLVQIYSANRPPTNSACDHLSLRSLSAIAQKVRQSTGLNVEVY